MIYSCLDEFSKLLELSIVTLGWANIERYASPFLYSRSPYGHHDLTIEEMYGRDATVIRFEKKIIRLNRFFISPIRVKRTKNFVVVKKKKKEKSYT